MKNCVCRDLHEWHVEFVGCEWYIRKQQLEQPSIVSMEYRQKKNIITARLWRIDLFTNVFLRHIDSDSRKLIKRTVFELTQWTNSVNIIDTLWSLELRKDYWKTHISETDPKNQRIIIRFRDEKSNLDI